MRLTALLFARKFPRGHIHRGKYRVVKEVDKKSLAQLRWDYEVEEQNMLILRHPYLTVEQSRGHMNALGRPPIQHLWRDEKDNKFSKVVTLEDRLSHLKVKDVWD